MYFWGKVYKNPAVVPVTSRCYIGGRPLPGVTSFAYYSQAVLLEQYKSILKSRLCKKKTTFNLFFAV